MLFRDVIKIMGKPKIKRYTKEHISITRNGLSLNPLTRDVYKINELVTHGGKITETAMSKTFDFAQANVPMKIYRTIMPTTQPPTNITNDVGTGFAEITDTVRIGGIKTLDGNVDYGGSITLNQALFQYMVELDLTSLATELGGNTKLKEALTGITVDAWAKGSGSNAGVLANGVKCYMWANDNIWSQNRDSGTSDNNTASLSKLSIGITTLSFIQNRITSSNKLYILIASQYSSDGVIPSSVSLDYISIKIDYKQRTVENGDSFYVGGDTETIEYDFYLKVAGSVVECPMLIKSIDSDKLEPPTASWWTDETQSTIDKIKSQNNIAVNSSRSILNRIAQLLVELDLTPLCNQLFGGSNSALKSALKSINVDVWCQGSGASGGVLTNGVDVKWWNQYNTAWVQFNNNTTSSIAKVSGNTISTSTIHNIPKLYILITSQYPSDGTIPSTVQLDFLSVKVTLTRTPDIVSPIPVKLGKYWAMVVKGFSPNFDSSNNITKRLFGLYNDTNNRFTLSRLATSFAFTKYIAGAGNELQSVTTNTFSKNQVINCLVGQSTSGMFMYLLKNNGTIEKLTNTIATTMSGIFPLYLLNQSNTQQADAFAESFHLVDLERIGKPNGFSDAEADSILRGVLPNPLGITNPELFDINKVQLHANARIENGAIVLNASGNDQSSIIEIPVLPNNKYILSGNSTGYIDSATRPYPYIICQYNNIATYIPFTTSQISTSTGNFNAEFITPLTCNKVVIKLANKGISTFTFSNISLKRKD